jgi:predicted AAA+ superfamily ATPase
MDKIFFYDLGIRNVLIDNLKDLPNRDDLGKLWENFLLVERMKFMKYSGRLYSPYFWRTYTGAELDYIEERSGTLSGFEFKFQAKGNRIPATFSATYPDSRFEEISRANYLDFILQD